MRKLRPREEHSLLRKAFPERGKCSAETKELTASRAGAPLNLADQAPDYDIPLRCKTEKFSKNADLLR